MPNNSKGLAEIHYPLRLGKTPTLMRMTRCEIVNLGIRAEFDKAFRRTIRRNPLDQQTPIFCCRCSGTIQIPSRNGTGDCVLPLA